MESGNASFEQAKTDLEKTPKTKILQVFTTLKIEDLKTWTLEQWTYLLSFFGDAFKSKLPDLTDAVKFVGQVKLVAAESNLGISWTILLFVTELLFQILSDPHTSQNTAEQNNIKNVINAVVKLLETVKVSSVKSLTDEHFELIIKVINQLYRIISLKPLFVNIITILEIWKSFSNFVSIYIKGSQAQAPHNINKLRQILEKPVVFLLQEIKNNIGIVQHVEALQRPTSQIEKYLRVTNFYLKILRGVSSGMKHEDFVAEKEFFESYKKSKLIPKHLIGTEIEKLLEKYIQTDFDLLLGFVYQHPDELRHLMEFIKKDVGSQMYILLDAYLSAIISNGDGTFISKNTATFIEIFELSFKDLKAYLNQNRGDIIAQFSALALLDEKPNLLNYFRQYIFKDNFWIASASTEVLMLLQRYQHKHLKQLDNVAFKELDFWQNCNSTFAIFSNDILQTHVVRLVKNCIQLNGSSSSTQLLKSPKINQLSPEEYRNQLLIGAYNSDEIETALSHLLDELSVGNGTTESYYKTVICIQLLTSLHSTPSKEIIINLVAILRKFLTLETRHQNQFSLFISASLRLLAKYIDTAQLCDVEQLSSCLNMINNVTTFPGSLKLLHSFSKGPSQKLKQQAVSILRQNKIELSGGLTFATVADTIEFIDSRKQSHTCSSSEEPQVKRKCFATNW